jgi:hypothetical protein
MYLRIGDVLVKQGILTEDDRDAVLEEQRQTGEPFGVIAERLFEISPHGIELAWAEQYAAIADQVDPRGERIDTSALDTIDRRQAWQFQVLPLHFDGPELVLCTTQENLPRALRFVGWRIGRQAYLVVSEAGALGEALASHYPMDGMTADMVRRSA